MSEKLGIKETKEAIVGVNELVVVIATLLKDGFQGSDVSAFAMKLASDSKFRDCLLAAQADANKIPDEMKDLSALEGVELAKIQIEYVPKIIEALKKSA